MYDSEMSEDNWNWTGESWTVVVGTVVVRLIVAANLVLTSPAGESWDSILVLTSKIDSNFVPRPVRGSLI